MDDVTLDPQAVKHDADETSDRMLVPISGYTLSEQMEGGSVTVHARKTGEVELESAGPARRWTNIESISARYVVVTFR